VIRTVVVAMAFMMTLAMSGATARAEHQGGDVDHRGGARPTEVWTCPVSHPIKGNFTPSSGERCIHHHPRHRYYGRTKPERCYVSDAEAQADGCRRAKI